MSADGERPDPRTFKQRMDEIEVILDEYEVDLAAYAAFMDAWRARQPWPRRRAPE